MDLVNKILLQLLILCSLAACKESTQDVGDTSMPILIEPAPAAVPDNTAPVLEPVGGRTVTVDKTLAIRFSATDAEQSNLVFSIENAPHHSTLIGNVFTFAPVEAQIGQQIMRVVVTDGVNSDDEQVVINVLPKGSKQKFEAFDYSQVLNDKFGLVYVRVARTFETIDFTEADGSVSSLKNLGILDKLPEVSHVVNGMNAPGQLVYRNSDGVEKIIFNCCADEFCKEPTLDVNGYACLPMDPSISYDGKEVIFSVLHRATSKVRKRGQYLPTLQFDAYLKGGYAQVHIANIQTGEITQSWPLQSDVFDTAPVFLPMNQIDLPSQQKVMFTSTEGGDHRTGIRSTSMNSSASMQMWIASRDGTKRNRTGVHDFDGVLHPFVQSTGRVLHSSWQLNHTFPFGHDNGSVGGFSTLNNMFWITSVDQAGGEFNAVFGAHKGHFSDRLENRDFYYPEGGNHNYLQNTYKALHFLGETSGGWICSTNYYRGNNLGGGQIHCWEPEPVGIEGAYNTSEAQEQGDVFRPRNLINISTWATSADQASGKDENGLFLGKLRDPEGLNGNHLMMTYLNGPCTSNTVLESDEIQHAEVGCDAGIYRTTQIPSRSPKDLQVIVDRPEFHEFMARVVLPYQERYGMPQPVITDSSGKRDPSGRCLLATSSMQSETDPFSGYRVFEKSACSAQGCKIVNVEIGEVKALRFWKINANKRGRQLWNSEDQKYHNPVSGNVMELMGDVRLLPDGSAVAELPCETPYVMAGVDAEGRTIMRDQVPQSLRKGEIRTCSGCHLHSRSGPDIELSMAKNNFDVAPVLGQGEVPMIKAGQIVSLTSAPILFDFGKDIQPIFDKHCVNCHNENRAEADLRLDIPGYSDESTYGRLVWDKQQKFVAPDRIIQTPNASNNTIPRPYTSKYFHSAFARESLLYWKAANARTDGRKDDSYEGDIDFGANHPVAGITDEELRTLSNWIDSGGYMSRTNH